MKYNREQRVKNKSSRPKEIYMSLNAVLIFLLVPLFVFEIKAQENFDSEIGSLKETPTELSSTTNLHETSNSEARASLEGLIEDNPEIRSLYENDPSLWLNGPAVVAYFTLGVGLITKLYLNWMKETRMIDEQGLDWPTQFNKLKTQMAQQYPHATALETEFLAMKKMENEKSPVPHCHSCDHHDHHHAHAHDHDHHHNPSTHKDLKGTGVESIEADLFKWMKVIGELGSIGNSGSLSKTNESRLSYLKRKKWNNLLHSGSFRLQRNRDSSFKSTDRGDSGYFSKQIDQHLEILKTDSKSLEKLRHDFDQDPFWKLNKRKKEFFVKYDPLIKNFFMGFARIIIRSGKILAWDYTAKPVYETFQTPRRKLLPLFVHGRVSRNEKRSY